MRQNKNQRDQQDQLAQAGHKQADLSLPQRHKALLAGALKAAGEDTRHINAHGPRRVADKLRVGGEDARQNLRGQHADDPEQGRQRYAEAELQPEGLLHAVGLAGAEVKAHQRLAALTDALQRHGQKLGYAGDDGHGAHGQIPAVARKTRVEADGQNALGGNHHKGGHAQRKAGQDDPPLQRHILGTEL